MQLAKPKLKTLDIVDNTKDKLPWIKLYII